MSTRLSRTTMPFELLALGSAGVTCRHWAWSCASIGMVGVISGVALAAAVATTICVGDRLTVGNDRIGAGVDGWVGSGVMVDAGNTIGTIVGTRAPPLQPI